MAHGGQLEKELGKLNEINVEDEKQIMVIKQLNEELGTLAKKADEYLRSKADRKVTGTPLRRRHGKRSCRYPSNVRHLFTEWISATMICSDNLQFDLVGDERAARPPCGSGP